MTFNIKQLGRGVLQAGITLFVMWLVLSVILVTAIIWYGTRDYAREADVIIVLGAGVRGDGSPSQTLVERAQQGARLWEQGIAPAIICTGGVVGDAPRAESDACREVLDAAGVPPDVVLWEEQSTTTAENVEHTLVLMAQHDMQSAVVVSSRYHLLRARWLYALAGQPVHTSPAAIGHLTTGEVLFSYTREWAAFHYHILREYLGVPQIYVPVP